MVYVLKQSREIESGLPRFLDTSDMSMVQPLCDCQVGLVSFSTHFTAEVMSYKILRYFGPWH